MKPKSLSASAIATFSSCEARYKAEWIDRVPSPSNSAASLGTALHGALEDFVSSGEAQSGAPVDVLLKHFENHYWQHFINADRLEEGQTILSGWFRRQNWQGVTVLSTEKKQSIQIPTSIGQIEFNFIFDRLDQLDDGTIRVVDYKSNAIPMTYDDLRATPQPQVYGMAARILFPEAPQVWVEFDFLRHDPIGIKVTRKENRATWEFIKATAERIIASDGTQETVNSTCVWCPRKGECDALKRHIEGGGFLGPAMDLDVVAARRAELDNAQRAIKKLIEEYDSTLTGYMQAEGSTELETSDGTKITLSSSRRREVDPQIVARVVGPEIFAKYGDIKIGKLESLIKDESLSPDQATALQNAVHWRHNRPGVKVKPRGPLGDE